MMSDLTTAAIDLLKDLIKIPSFSKQEDKTAMRIGDWFDNYGIPYEKFGNNLWAKIKTLIHQNQLFF